MDTTYVSKLCESLFFYKMKNNLWLISMICFGHISKSLPVLQDCQADLCKQWRPKERYAHSNMIFILDDWVKLLRVISIVEAVWSHREKVAFWEGKESSFVQDEDFRPRKDRCKV